MMASPKLKFAIVLAGVVLVGAAGTFAVQSHRVTTDSPHEHGVEESGMWYCPMHAHVTSDHEGSCPICGMKLVKRSEGAMQPAEGQVFVAPNLQQRLGVAVETVEAIEFRPTIPVAAQVIPDERRTVTLSPKVEGWIRKLGISAVGQPIKAGEVLFEIYSPELQERQKDYVDLLTRRDALLASKGGQGGMTVGNSAPDLMLASVARERYRVRRRLLAADVPDSVLDDLERFRRVHEVIPVIAQHDGVVTGIGAREGAYVRPGEIVVTYTDPHSAWAELVLAPADLAQLQHGDSLELHSASDHDLSVSSVVDPALKTIDPVSRTARLRVPLADTAHRLFPGMLLEGVIQMKPRHAVTIPADSVLRTGRGDFVVLATPNNHFRQRQVHLGAESEDRVEVLQGLSAGEKLVTNGQFMVSAEGSLQSSWRRFAAAGSPESPVAEHAQMHAPHAMHEPPSP